MGQKVKFKVKWRDLTLDLTFDSAKVIFGSGRADGPLEHPRRLQPYTRYDQRVGDCIPAPTRVAGLFFESGLVVGVRF